MEKRRGGSWPGPVGMALLYFLAGSLWIAGSDQLVARYIRNEALRDQWQSYKDWVFIAFTAVVLYAMLRAFSRSQQHQADQFRLLINNLPSVLVIHDGQGRFEFVNTLGEALGGYRLEEMVGHTHDELFPPETYREYLPLLQEAIATGQPQSGECQVTLPHGTYTFFINFVPLLEQDGKVQQVFAIGVDITGRKRAEQELRETKNLLEKTFASLNEAVFLINPADRTVITCNAAVERILGYQVEELVGQSTMVLYVSPESYQHFGEMSATTRMEMGEFQTEYTLRRKDGQVIQTEHNVIWLPGENGKDGLAISVVRDITERKRAEEQLKLYAQRLEVLQQIDRAILAAESPQFIARTAIQHLASLIHCQRIVVMVFDFTRREVKLLAVYMTGRPWSGESSSFPLEQIESAIPMLRHGQPYHVNDIAAMKERSAFLQLLYQEEGLQSLLMVPLIAQGELMGSLNLGTPSPSVFTPEQIALVQEVANEVAVAIQHTGLIEELEYRLAELNSIQQASQELQQLLTPDKLAPRIISVLNQTLTYEYAAVMLFNERGYLELFAGSARDGRPVPVASQETRINPRSLEPDEGILSRVALHGESLNVTAGVKGELHLVREDACAELCVPLRLGNHIIGAVAVGTTQPVAFEPAEQRVLETVAVQIATAIQNARLLELEREARQQLRDLANYLQTAREEERARIAREIHDEFGQVLTGLKMDLSWMAKRLPADQPQLADKAQVMSKMIDQTIQVVRQIATELRPGLLDDLGLVTALEWQAREFCRRREIAFELTSCVKEVELDRDLSTAIFRIFQEILTNVARHAEAHKITVSFERQDSELTLTVHDDGRGITRKQINSPKSLGLIGMRERAHAWGGNVTFQGAPDKGTTVTVCIPWRPQGGVSG
ncbi:MAG: PAS domain S-box protein [Chloroflexi bacterium]|nr:PAS domain S-box protein [Chloroflexota bacterium]MCI0647656.1 PAS domain S-box protein [Chloroflexota bacterium]MCI0730086.1 PAS domain S-box protein [Chloroflexota bacterium]